MGCVKLKTFIVILVVTLQSTEHEVLSEGGLSTQYSLTLHFRLKLDLISMDYQAVNSITHARRALRMFDGMLSPSCLLNLLSSSPSAL